MNEHKYFVSVHSALKDNEGKFSINPTRSRCWGFFPSFGAAEKIVLNNVSDIFEENYYNLALIEKISEGLFGYSDGKNNSWYEAKYSIVSPKHSFGSNPDSIIKIDEPEFAKNIVGWAIG